MFQLIFTRRTDGAHKSYSKGKNFFADNNPIKKFTII